MFLKPLVRGLLDQLEMELGFMFFMRTFLSHLMLNCLSGTSWGEVVSGIRVYQEKNKKCREKNRRERGSILRFGQ